MGLNNGQGARILIIKLGAIGDVLRTTSILQGLRKKYTHCQITWVTKENAAPLLVNNLYVAKVFVYGKKTIKFLLEQKFDIIINLDEDFEACSLATNIKKRKIYGFYLNKNNEVVPTATAKEWFDMSALGKKPENDILKKKNKKTYQQIMHDICELPNNNPDTLLYLNNKQIQCARDFRRRYNINFNDFVVGLNTGAGDRWPKQLSVKNTAKLAEILQKKYHAKIILFGGPNEIERNNKIISLAKVPIIHSGCGNDLFEFPALISVCNLVVTSDSLGMHIALGLKRKTVAFFGPTSAAEIDMYGLGEKVVSTSDCYCCYKPSCTAIHDITEKHVEKAIKNTLKQSVSIIITSFNEPKLKNAIEAVLAQENGSQYEIVVVAPDKEAEYLVKAYATKYNNLRFFKDPGKGKSYALNLVFEKLQSDVFVLTDGDVVLDKHAVKEILYYFNDPLIGVATGRVISANPKKNMYGFWSHLLADAGAHKIRRSLFRKRTFLECSGYLFAFRNNVLSDLPLDVAEDAYIPYLFWQKGYKIAYAEKSKVYVWNPTNFDDWLKQRIRTSKAHETLDKYVDVNATPRVKSFTNELKKGFLPALLYPKSISEYYWTLLLFLARGYMWTKVHFDTKIKARHYTDAWERIETAR